MNLETSRLYVLAEELGLQFENKRLYNKNQLLQNLKKVFPSVKDEDLKRFFALMEIQHELETVQKVQMEVVVTAPPEVLNQRRTIGVLRESIENANRTILITGYSVSEFATEIINLLIEKSRMGIKVKFFIDKNVDPTKFQEAISTPNFELYKYKSSKEFSSMHAKIIILDDETAFISSSNLSYNGIVNNLEIGAVITGKAIEEFKEIFNELIAKEYFYRVY
ncbi:phospholipase D-like domain-containing protein [Planomicrobium sp. MB-3u-38]|uniref:phospholipase D-like domain-containing protein n=1 Tax=Planomicrobium sp. MB-3u-38 TaxID=2058318 RepID=UPI000C7D06AD|nr:phospholipase D-like domain-containing protein [Planomicrobium sp. MB-3u-38]PKH10674.1 hypothetical protein CXF70_07995 [Planomicrobium sp. MB-3u-38]